MSTKSVRLILTLSACALTVGAIPSFATPIAPGGSVAPSAISSLGTFTTVTTTGLQTITTPTFSATYTESIIKSSMNPFGANDLAFVMTFTNTAASNDAIHRATNGFGTLGGFDSVSSDVAYVTGSGAVPTTADESSPYGTIGFNFTGVMPGSTSDTFVIFTNATNYRAGFFSLIDSVSGYGPGFIPAAATSTTPEPSSLILMGTGLVGLAGAARRRFKL